MAATSNEPVLLLKTAVNQITDYITTHNMAPQDALHKVAVELDLAPAFIKRASEAVNVGLTHSHFKKNASARDSEFAITDAEPVVTQIFGEAVKKASYADETASSLCVENFKLGMHKFASPLYKKAYADIITADNPEQQMSARGVAEKSALYVDSLEKKAADAHTEAVGADFDLQNAFSSVVYEFSKEASARQEWHDFESQVYAEHGDKAVPYLDLMYKAAGFTNEPRGTHKSNYTNYKAGPQTTKFASVMSAVEKLHLTKEAERIAADNLKEAKDAVAEAFQEIGRTKLAMMHDAGDVTLLEEIVQEKKAEEKQAAEWIATAYKGKAVHFKNVPKAHKLISAAGGTMQAYASLKAHGLIKESEEDPVLKLAEEKQNKAETTLQHVFKSFDFGKPGHGHLSAENDNAKRQQLLSELITTDPILKEVDPQHIADAYLQMTQLSPELSLHKEVVRGHLRQAAQGQALNPHDADLLSKTNKGLLENRDMRDPVLSRIKRMTPGGSK